jgi:hypothetical protein
MDEEDLAVISAHAQDALLPVGDMLYQARTRQFVMALRRCNWQAPETGERVQTVLHFDHVHKAALSGFRQDRPEDVLHLLSITFVPGAAPSGAILLAFSGDCSLRLDVECIEARLADLGPRWRCRQAPAPEHKAPARDGWPTQGGEQEADAGKA